MRDASKRAAKRDIADVRLAALGDGTTNDAANAKSKSAKSKSGHNNATMSRYAHREKFVKDMKKDYTIVAPQMSPIHFSLVESVIRSGGYKFDILKHASREDVETGLKYVNNDACYPPSWSSDSSSTRFSKANTIQTRCVSRLRRPAACAEPPTTSA